MNKITKDFFRKSKIRTSMTFIKRGITKRWNIREPTDTIGEHLTPPITCGQVYG